MRLVLFVIFVALLFVGFGCKSYTTYTEILDVDGKVVSRTVTIEQDKLKEKGVAFGGSVSAADIECDLNMSSGSPMPLPKVKMGFFTFFWIDAPIETGGIYFNQEKSLWTGSVASTTYVKFGSTQKKGGIRMTSEPEPIFQIPGFSVDNPLVPNKVMLQFIPEASAGVDSGMKTDSIRK